MAKTNKIVEVVVHYIFNDVGTVHLLKEGKNYVENFKRTQTQTFWCVTNK